MPRTLTLYLNDDAYLYFYFEEVPALQYIIVQSNHTVDAKMDVERGCFLQVELEEIIARAAHTHPLYRDDNAPL